MDRACIRDDGRVVSNFIVQAIKGEPITLYGDGSQTRSFCYVDDLIEGFVRLMDSPAEFTGPVNLGNPGEFTIRAPGRESPRRHRFALRSWNSVRCPSTIRSSASPISRSPSPGLAGRPR